METHAARPLIVGLGGTTRTGSSSELVLRASLEAVERAGGDVLLFAGPDLQFPIYAPENPARDQQALRFLDAIRRADGVIIASPGYHGSLSGQIKNVLDYIEDLRTDERPYLDGRAVGCIACAYGWQATGSTLAALRSVAHALRAWPTPLGIAVNTSTPLFDAAGLCRDAALLGQLKLMAEQVVTFAQTYGRSFAQKVPA